MAVPNENCEFILDGVIHKGMNAFLDHILSKDVNVTPEQESSETTAAKDYGFNSVHEAIGSVNKRLGTEYKKFADIPKPELEKAAKDRRSDVFNRNIDEGAKKLIERLTPSATKAMQEKGGVSAAGGTLATIVNEAADMIKNAYKLGQDIKEAVNNAIDHIKKNWDKSWGEFDEHAVADYLNDAGALSIDEEIERTFGLAPKDVLDIWNSSNAGHDNPELLKFIQTLSGDDKKRIVKDAMKGILSKDLDQFIKTIKEKTGNTIDIMSHADLKKMVDDRINEELQKEADKRMATKKAVEDALKAATKSPSILDRIKNSNIVNWVTETAKGIGLAFHPAMFEGKELARDAMMLIRKEKGKEAQQNELADSASRKAMNEWNFVPKLDKLGFILSIENADKYGTADPRFKKLADAYRARMDAVFNLLSSIKDLPYIEDYFPHFWEKPEQAKKYFASVYSKRPLEGSKSFLKKRFYEDILGGMQAGLKLATDNPEEIVRLAEMNALKFQTAHDIFSEMKSRELIKFFKLGQQPDGWKLVEDPIFKRMALFTKENEDGEAEAGMSRGGYYMPEPVARVVDNYLSRGLAGSGVVGRNVYTAVHEWNNVKNLFQLGMGFFHFTTTTVDSTVTGVGNAVSEMLSGKPKGLVDLVKAITVIPNIAHTLSVGDKAIKQYRTSQISPDVQAMVDANARTGLSKIYTLDSYYNLKKAIGRLSADKDFGAIPAIVKNALLFLPEATAKPLMEWYVPRLKVGGYLRTLEVELNAKKGLTPDQIVKVKQRVWDSMDDRLGQMVYDNMFWHKSMKDIAFLTIRSFGWTGGTIRAFGKGIGGVPESGKRLVKGHGINPETAWLISLPATVGLYGAMYQYMMTGKGPDEAKDYFFPKDGTTNPDGTAHRVTIPSYMKDFFAYGKHPVETLEHKTSPTVNEVIDLFSNQDFYGTQIWNPKDPIYENGLDILKYEGESFVPFSFKQQSGSQPTPRQQVEQKFGIMPATSEFQRTPLQNSIIQQVTKEYGNEVKTTQDADRISARREVRERLFKGEGWDKLPDDLKNRAAYNPKTQQKVIQDATLDPYKRMFSDLKSEQQIEVWSKMNDDDKKDYMEYLNNRSSFIELHNEKPELFEDKEIEKAYQEIIGQAHETRGRKKGGLKVFN